MSNTERYLCEAIELAQANVEQGGRPFGAVIVRNGEVIARGVNEIHSTNDPTAHAELTALRAAGQTLNHRVPGPSPGAVIWPLALAKFLYV
jgi:guanine deaminase